MSFFNAMIFLGMLYIIYPEENYFNIYSIFLCSIISSIGYIFICYKFLWITKKDLILKKSNKILIEYIIKLNPILKYRSLSIFLFIISIFFNFILYALHMNYLLFIGTYVTIFLTIITIILTILYLYRLNTINPDIFGDIYMSDISEEEMKDIITYFKVSSKKSIKNIKKPDTNSFRKLK